MLHRDSAGDHIHEIATEDDNFVGVCDFDYSEVDRGLGWSEDSENMISMSDCAAALSLVIEHCLQAKSLTLAGAKLAALAVFLDPINNSKFGSTLSEIAREAGCTRAALSKSLVDFRDAAGVHLSMGKLAGSRKTYRAVQVEALAKGTHSSFKRRSKAN